MARLPVPVKDSDSIAPGEKSEVSGQLAERRPAVPRCRNGGTRCAQVLFLLPVPRWPFADEQRQYMGREGAIRAVFVLIWAIHDEGRTALVERVQGFRVVPPAVCGIFSQLVISNPSGPLMA